MGHGAEPLGLGTFQCDSGVSNGWWLCAPCPPQCSSLTETAAQLQRGVCSLCRGALSFTGGFTCALLTVLVAVSYFSPQLSVVCGGACCWDVLLSGWSPPLLQQPGLSGGASS